MFELFPSFRITINAAVIIPVYIFLHLADVLSDFTPSGDTVSNFSWRSLFVLQMTFPCLLQGEEIIRMGGAKTSTVEMRDEYF